MRFANSPCYEEQQNLLAFQFEGDIYYKTFKYISPHTQLLVCYGEQYGAELGIIATNKQSPSNQLSDVNNLDLVCNFSEPNWLCHNCNCIYTSEVLYHKHMRLKHGKPLPVKLFMKSDEIKKNMLQGVKRRTTQISLTPLIFCLWLKYNQCVNLVTVKLANQLDNRYHIVPPGGEPYTCPICGKQFHCSGTLCQHKRVHIAEKLYKCTVCGKDDD